MISWLNMPKNNINQTRNILNGMTLNLINHIIIHKNISNLYLIDVSNNSKIPYKVGHIIKDKVCRSQTFMELFFSQK